MARCGKAGLAGRDWVGPGKAWQGKAKQGKIFVSPGGQETQSQSMTYTTKPAHEPTPEEIAARCQEIRATWNETTEKHRKAWTPPEWLPPRVGMSKRASRTVIAEPGEE